MLYLVQDLSERMWLVDDIHLITFLKMAETKGSHQDMLDELSLSREEQESIGDELQGDDMWQLNSTNSDYPMATRFCPEPVANDLMLVPVTPAEMAVLSGMFYAAA